MPDLNLETYVKQCCDDPTVALATAQNFADVHFAAQGQAIPSWLLIIIAILEKLLPLIPVAQTPKP